MKIHYILILLFAHVNLNSQVSWEIQRDAQSFKYGTVDPQGNTIIPYSFNKLRLVNDTILLASTDEKWYLIDETGKRKSDNEYKYLSQTKENLLLLFTDSLVGAIDINEHVVIEPTYEFLHQYTTDLFSATLNKKKGLININEDIIVPFEYNGLLMYLDLLFLRKDKKWAIADKMGNLKSDFIYKYVSYRKGNNFITLSNDEEIIKIDSKGNKLQ